MEIKNNPLLWSVESGQERLAIFTSGRGIFCEIYWEAATKTISDVWCGDSGTQEKFKEVLITLLELAKQHKAKKWFANTYGMVGGFKSTEKWLKTDIMTQAESIGITSEAVVFPKNIFANFSVKATAEALQAANAGQGGLVLKTFLDPMEAQQWLKEQPLVRIPSLRK